MFVSLLCRFAVWLIRPLACSPPHVDSSQRAYRSWATLHRTERNNYRNVRLQRL